MTNLADLHLDPKIAINLVLSTPRLTGMNVPSAPEPVDGNLWFGPGGGLYEWRSSAGIGRSLATWALLKRFADEDADRLGIP